MKNRATIIRLIVSLALLSGLLYWIGIESLAESLRSFNPVWYAVAVALIFSHFFIQAITLRALLLSKNIHVTTCSVFRLMIISYFFGLFLPGGIGPDLVLCYNLVKTAEKKEDVLSAVVFIRISVLFILIVFAFLFSFTPMAAGLHLQFVTGALVFAFLCYYFIMANKNTLSIASRLLDFLNRHHFTSLLYKTYFALSEYGKDRRMLLRILPWFFLSWLLKITVDFIIALSLGLDIHIVYFIIFIPLVSIAAIVPLTLAGIGIREGSFVGLFGMAGVEASDAFSISILSFSLNFWLAFAGMLLFAIHGAGIIIKQSEVYSEHVKDIDHQPEGGNIPENDNR